MNDNVPYSYIIHGIEGYESREAKLKENMSCHKLDFEFVTEYESEETNAELIKKYYREDPLEPLTKGKLYCTLVHILAYEKMVARKQKYALIFENDVCFLRNFEKNLSEILKEAEDIENGFLISLENSTLRFPAWWKVRRDKMLYEADFGRCAGAYLINLEGAQKILESLQTKGFSKVIDWWHNEMVQEEIIKIYWAHPPLTEQVSFNGELSSSIAVRHGGNIRSLKWQLQKFIKMYVIRWFRFR